MTWVIEDENGGARELDSRAEAEEAKAKLEQLGAEIELRKKTTTDGGSKVEVSSAKVVEMSQNDGGNNDNTDTDEIDESESTVEATPEPVDDVPESSEAVQAIEAVKDNGLNIDPLSVLPGFMVDSIKGQQAVNKRGYAMIAERYVIEVSTEMVQSPWDNNEGRVVCKATATTDDERTYTAYGTACADDGDDPANLIELADTRSQKRAIQWASGYGIVGYQELTGQLEENQ